MAEIFEEHSELHHYTDLSGVRGILETQTLWATHYTGLNDLSEIHHLRVPLEKILFGIVNDELRRKSRESLSFKIKLNKFGGLAVQSKEMASILVDILYRISFEHDDEGGPFADPYIVSFCAHSNDSPYCKKHGLLSQWRGYGTSGRFALVFDTQQLTHIMNLEVDRFEYSHFALSDVVYDPQPAKVEEEFPDLCNNLRSFVSENLIGEAETFASNLYTPFVEAVTRCKHRAFEEEREVRWVAVPTTEEVHKTMIKEGEVSNETPRKDFKEIHSRDKAGVDVRFTKLNHFADATPLPIKRIIVGPQKDQTEQLRMLKKLVGRGRIPIVCSETPYIGS